jgi:hypothetical protein
LRSPEPAFGYVLITLAGYANADGVCYPGYGTLMQDTAYTSKQTITGALKYWRGLGVLTWKKGWGNVHKSRPNVYQFHEDAMRTLYAKQKAERGNLNEPVDESSVRADEISVEEVRNLSLPGMKAHSVVDKVLAAERPSKQNVQAANSGGALFLDVDTGRQESVQHSPTRECPVNEISSERSPNGISSSAHAVPTDDDPSIKQAAQFRAYLMQSDYSNVKLLDGVTWYEEDREWGARPGIGRPTTEAERMQIIALNRSKVKPHQIQGAQ